MVLSVWLNWYSIIITRINMYSLTYVRPTFEIININTVGLLPIAFLSRVSILLLTRDIDIAILSVRLSVRLSVCLSVTRWYCMKTA